MENQIQNTQVEQTPIQPVEEIKPIANTIPDSDNLVKNEGETPNVVEQIMNDLQQANEANNQGTYSPEPKQQDEGHNLIIPGPGDDFRSAEKPKMTNTTNTTLATLQNSGARGQPKFEEETDFTTQQPTEQVQATQQPRFNHQQEVNDEEYRNLPLVNPLLYKPASKPPVIREGDWLCPDPTVSFRPPFTPQE